MNTKYLLLIGCAVALSCRLAAAGPCNERIDISSPTPRFTITDERVTDLRTGLEWQRCPVGYVLDNNDTTGEPHDDNCTLTDPATLSWADALQSAEDKNAAAGLGEPTDWRVPNIKELLSIVERQCVNPAINGAAFPQPPSTFIGLVWSATYSNNVVSGPSAYALNFGSGSPSLQARGADGGLYNVLLVRQLSP